MDSRTGTWVQARYKASLDEIIARYDRWQIIGPPDTRASIPVKMFTPFGERMEPPLEVAPSLDGLERFLARLLLAPVRFHWHGTKNLDHVTHRKATAGCTYRLRSSRLERIGMVRRLSPAANSGPRFMFLLLA